MTENKPNQQSRIISIDYGLARIGMAISDPTKLIAAPLETILTEKSLEKTAAKLLSTLNNIQKEYRCTIEALVIGLPLHLNGKVGVIADEIGLLISLLKKDFTQPIITWDERLSTVLAERSLRESNMTRKQRSKLVDQVTAVILLQNYLDHLIYLKNLNPS